MLGFVALNPTYGCDIGQVTENGITVP